MTACNTNHTEQYGSHDRVVRRPPRQDRHAADTAVEAAIRLECLECGFCSQGPAQVVEGRFLNEVSCDETVVLGAVSRDSGADCSADPATLTSEHQQLARDLAADTDLPLDNIAGRIKQLHEYTVPTEDIEQAIRNAAAGGGDR